VQAGKLFVFSFTLKIKYRKEKQSACRSVETKSVTEKNSRWASVRKGKKYRESLVKYL